MNEPLEKGDRVMLLHMEDKTTFLAPGTWGTVKGISHYQGIAQYNMTWDDGTKDSPGKVISTLGLLSDVDAWTKSVPKKKTNETFVLTKKDLIKEMNDMESEWEWNKSMVNQRDVLNNFDVRFFKKYLNTLKESGIVNMFGASPYLYMGRNRIKHEFTYNEPPNEDAFEELLDMADEAQAKMINGVIKILENKGEETDLNNINSKLKKYSHKILNTWILLYNK